ncbi:MAG: RdgB/HAM1 family non-canonical purine NTP pyrophosphatase [Christensenellaceae bacterium]
MKTVILASNNKGKIAEFNQLFKDKFNVVSMSEAGFFGDIEENGSTFYENALIKAETVSRYCKLPAIADDSGLVVEALNGEPGIYSARYAGEHGDDKKNNALLLKNLQNVENRKAKFHSTIVLYDDLTKETVFGEGETFGEILLKEEGENGFGYDPLFYSYDLKKSFGLASSEEKNRVSHRYRALVNLLEKLK